MKKKSISILALAVITAGAVFADHHLAGESEKATWKNLFNGKDLTGWKNPYGWGKAEVTDGEIHLTAEKKFFLVADDKYADFIFEAEVHLPEGKANSGFMFRCHVEPDKVYGYQAEVDGSDRRWSGGLYDESRRGWIWPYKEGKEKGKGKKEHASRKKESLEHFAKEEVKGALKRNGWNKYRIECRGDHLKVTVNGVVTTDVRDSKDAEGYLAIQHHGEKGATYRFRNLRVQVLGK